MYRLCLQNVALLSVLFLIPAAWAEDVSYCRVPIRDLQIIEGQQPQPPKYPPEIPWRRWQLAREMLPYVVLDGPGEAFVNLDYESWSSPRLLTAGVGDAILIRTTQVGNVTGRLFYPDQDWSGMTIIKFKIPFETAKTDEAQATARRDFFRAQWNYYKALLARGLPGAAWFRHQAHQARLALGEKDGIPERPAAESFAPPHELEETYTLFSGGRAMNENLQLDRLVRIPKAEEETVDVDTLEGISVPEINWAPLVKDLKPELDPLAVLIPADQHVVFFPTFSAASQVADEAERQSTPVLYLAEPVSEDARTLERYQRQLCLSITALGRLLGPHVIKSMALTGSDPYYRTGTDVAVLFEAQNPPLLETLLFAQIQMGAAAEPKAEPVRGEVRGIKYQGFRSPDRRVCSYLARLDEAVVVTNALYQLERLAEVQQKRAPAIASLPEYVFFRDRYRRGDPEESAFVFLSDATIRRWCGPRWRIASSRRIRDMAVVSELQAVKMDRLAKKTVQPGPLYTDLVLSAGELLLDEQGVYSSVYGRLDFQTPIAEIPLRKVTQAEAEAYRWWREGYQRNWRWAFDPIAMRLTIHEGRLAADLSIMPLIFGSEYREMVSISAGAKLAPDAGDPHDALVHFILAVNRRSPVFAQANNFLGAMARGVTLGWLGPAVSLFADDGPEWQELTSIPPEELDEGMPQIFWRLPMGVRVEVADGLMLTAFLTGLRATIEQTAPGMVLWESLTYEDQPYVKITPTERATGQYKELEKAAIYYAVSGDALLVSVNEDVIKRALDRQLTRAAAEKGEPAAKANSRPWLGSNVGLQVDRKAIDIFSHLRREDYQSAMQIRSWSNIPILNHWKRLYPDQDPVELHERVWKVRLICPGGGRYVWNEKYQTMESTVYGHPGEPRVGPPAPPVLRNFTRGDFGLTFEMQGLRAKAVLESEADSSRAP